MAVKTNNVIEFSSQEALKQYLTNNADYFANTNYLISKIGSVWHVTIPRGYVDGNNTVRGRESFNAYNGVDLDDTHTWSPGTTVSTANAGDYVDVRSSNPINWSQQPLTSSEVSYILSATFHSINGSNTIKATSDADFKNKWKQYHTSYRITQIQTWGHSK